MAPAGSVGGGTTVTTSRQSITWRTATITQARCFGTILGASGMFPCPQIHVGNHQARPRGGYTHGAQSLRISSSAAYSSGTKLLTMASVYHYPVPRSAARRASLGSSQKTRPTSAPCEADRDRHRRLQRCVLVAPDVLLEFGGCDFYGRFPLSKWIASQVKRSLRGCIGAASGPTSEGPQNEGRITRIAQINARIARKEEYGTLSAPQPSPHVG